MRSAGWVELILLLFGGVVFLELWVAALDVGGCVTYAHSLLKSKTVSETEQKTFSSTVSRKSQLRPRPSPSHTPCPSLRGEVRDDTFLLEMSGLCVMFPLLRGDQGVCYGEGRGMG